MSEKMECPVCGKMFPATECEFLDNGNPACPKCVKEEREKLEARIKQK